MTPFCPWESIIVIEVSYQSPKIKSPFDGVQLKGCTWQLEAIWLVGSRNKGTQQTSCFTALFQSFQSTAQGVEKGYSRSLQGFRNAYVFTINVVRYLSQNPVVWESRAALGHYLGLGRH